MERTLFVLSGVFGFLAVALGAFGAHGLRRTLGEAAEGAQRLAFWETAAHYHLVHALSIALSAYLVAQSKSPGIAAASGFCFAAGILLFSGSLYAMTLTNVRALGAVTPFGGVLLLSGWACVVIAGANAA